MKSKDYTNIAIIFLFIIGVATLLYPFIKRNYLNDFLEQKKESNRHIKMTERCPNKKVVAVRDNYVGRLAQKGEKVQVLDGGIHCGPFYKGEVVLFKISGKVPPVLRVIQAHPGDRFDVFLNKEQKRWNIKINGQRLMFLKNEPYGIGNDQRPPILKEHELEFKGIVPDDKVMILSQVPPGTQDSATFGLVNIDQIIGRDGEKKK